MNLHVFLRQQTSQRKLRLFAVACCNKILHLMKDQRSINAIKVAELYADGLATKEELNTANVAADAAVYTAATFATDATVYAAYAAASAAAADTVRYAAARKKQQQIAEDIFQTPTSIIPTSPLVLAIAKTIYTDKCWIDMPILADALEDAGCIDNELLAHLRSNQSHVKGCWALDLILRKE